MLRDRYLEAFYAVAETGSFSVAAERLYLSKATVIQQINFLEEWCGFSLFNRSNKGAELTPEGRYFMGETQKIQRTIDPIIHRCRMSQIQNVIRIGVLPNFEAVILPEICSRFKELYPDIEIQFVERPLRSYYNSFDNGQFSITAEYIPYYRYSRPSYCFHKIQDDIFTCAVPQTHPLYNNESITYNDLAGQRIMMYSKNTNRESDFLRESLIKNVSDLTVVDLNSYKSTLSLECELTNSIVFLPSLYTSSFPSLKNIPFNIGKDFNVSLGFGYYADSGPATLKFIDVVKEMFPLSE